MPETSYEARSVLKKLHGLDIKPLLRLLPHLLMVGRLQGQCYKLQLLEVAYIHTQ